MQQFTLLDRCHNPRFIQNSNGESILVPCNVCDECISAYQKQWSIRLDAESKNSASVLFFTLTYNNENLPIYAYNEYNETFQSPNREVSTFDLFDLSGVKNPLLINQNPSNLIPNRLVIPQPKNYPIDNPCFGFVCKSDVQKYLKRLRINVKRDPLKILTHVPENLRELRYFVCSEYGPQTFRPHYHGLLFFSNIDVARAVEKHYHAKSWKLASSAQCPIESVRTTASAYVSKYIRKSSGLLPLLTIPNISKNFSLFSRRPAIGFNSDQISELLNHVENDTITYDKAIIDAKTSTVNLVSVPYNKSVTNFVFPKTAYNSYANSRELASVLRTSYYAIKSSKIPFRNSYLLDYEFISSILPNRVSTVNSMVDSLLQTWLTQPAEYSNASPKPTHSSVVPFLSHTDFWFGISANRRLIIRALFTCLSQDMSIEDYIILHSKYHKLNKQRTLSSFYNFQLSLHSKGYNLLEISLLSFPEFFTTLPHTVANRDLSIKFESLGFSFDSIYIRNTDPSIFDTYVMRSEFLKLLNYDSLSVSTTTIVDPLTKDVSYNSSSVSHFCDGDEIKPSLSPSYLSLFKQLPDFSARVAQLRSETHKTIQKNNINYYAYSND